MKNLFCIFLIVSSSVCAQPKITSAEYYWGTIDPGIGNGVSLSVDDSIFDEVVESLVATYINLQTTVGPVLFNIRVKDVNNLWGTTFKKVIFILPSDTSSFRQVMLTKFEYFFGNFDPGEGSGTTIVAFDGALDEALETVFRSQLTWDVTSGPILFNIRAKDSENKWGPLFRKTVFPYGANSNPNLVQEGDALQICPNSTVTLNYTGPNGFTPTWFDGTQGQSVTFTPTSEGDYSVSATLDNITYTDAINISFKPLPIATMTPSGQVLVCATSNFNLVANSGTNLKYQWTLNGNAIISGINANYLPTATGSYAVKVTDSSTGCTKTSDVTLLSSSFLMSPNGTNSFCGAQLISVPSGSSNGYQWKKDGVNISGATSASYSATTSGSYTCVITNGSCSSTTSATILNTTNAGTISGTQSICTSGTATFTSNGTSGGTWTSSDISKATINATTGVITAVATGTSTITYTVIGSGGCADAKATRTVTVTAAPNAGTISGTQSICSGGTATFTSNGTSGGTWSSSDISKATINASTGVITAVATGTSTITYTVIGSGVCADAKATRTVTVTAAPNAGTISGTQSICSGGTATFTSNGTSGGTWSSSDISKATINASTGVITAVAAGTSTITYTVIGSGGCTDAKATRTVTVTAAPNAGTISGTQSICSGGTATFTSNGTLGGRWTSFDISKATINASTGVITAVATGTSTITYTVISSGGCADAKATRTVTVAAAPNAPTGSTIQSLVPESTLNSLIISGTNIQWYSSSTSSNPLSNTTLLVNGTTYYASQTINGCEGPRLSVTVQVQLATNDFNTIKISYSPNPVTNLLDVKSNEILKKVSIMNALGQILYSRNCNETDIQLDLSSFSAGSYFVSVNGEVKKNVFKIIKK